MILEMVINARPFGEEYFHASRLMCVVISASLLPRRQSVRKNAGAGRPPTAPTAGWKRYCFFTLSYYKKNEEKEVK